MGMVIAAGAGRHRAADPTASCRAGCTGLAGVAGLLAAWLYQRMRVRQAFRLQREELAASAASEVFSLRVMRQILRSDPDYRRFLTWLAFYGSGNLMIGAQLVILFSDHLHLPAALQVRHPHHRAAAVHSAVHAHVGAPVRRRARDRIPRAPVLGRWSAR